NRVTSLYAGFFDVNRYELEVERHDGGIDTLIRDVMERGDSVAVLGYDPSRDEVVLVNEFRPGLLAAGDYPFTDSLAAGAIEKGAGGSARWLVRWHRSPSSALARPWAAVHPALSVGVR